MSNTIDWGKIHYNSWSPETNLTGTGATPSYQNEYSFQFDGIDDYIDCNSASSSISADNEGTISVWIKADTLANVIACISVSSSQKQFLILNISGATGGLQVQMKNDGGSSTGWILRQDTSLTLNTWHHLAVVQDGVEPILYVDGVAVAQTFVISDNKQKWVNDFTGTANLLNIGRFKTSLYNQGYFDGLIDEFSYFSSALSSTDIEIIYNNGVPNNLNDLSTLPTIWYRMGEAATFDGIRDWDLLDQGTGGNDAVSQNIAESERVTDVPT